MLALWHLLSYVRKIRYNVSNSQLLYVHNFIFEVSKKMSSLLFAGVFYDSNFKLGNENELMSLKI